MPRRNPYTKKKLVGDIAATFITSGVWLIFRPFWELYQWTEAK